MAILSTEIEKRIRQYLDEVARRLSGVSEKSRQETLQDLESHIHEAFQRRSGASLADLEAVLAEMDPPESYAAGTGQAFPMAIEEMEPKIIRQILKFCLPLVFFTCWLWWWWRRGCLYNGPIPYTSFHHEYFVLFPIASAIGLAWLLWRSWKGIAAGALASLAIFCILEFLDIRPHILRQTTRAHSAVNHLISSIESFRAANGECPYSLWALSPKYDYNFPTDTDLSNQTIRYLRMSDKNSYRLSWDLPRGRIGVYTSVDEKWSQTDFSADLGAQKKILEEKSADNQ